MKEQARQFEEIERVTIRSTFVERVISRVRDYRPHSKVDRVVIPFAGKLEEKLPDNLEMRWNHLTFLKLIASVVLVKAISYRGFYNVVPEAESPPIEDLPMKIAIATIADFEDA